MATNITMPQMGFDMTEGTIANWLKNEGDPVLKGDPIAEIETDKTTIQIEAFASGVLAKIVVPFKSISVLGAIILRLVHFITVPHNRCFGLRISWSEVVAMKTPNMIPIFTWGESI